MIATLIVALWLMLGGIGAIIAHFALLDRLGVLHLPTHKWWSLMGLYWFCLLCALTVSGVLGLFTGILAKKEIEKLPPHL